MITSFNLWYSSLTLLAVFIISRIQKGYNGRRAVGYLTGMIVPFQPVGFPGGAIRTSWWNPGLDFLWKWRNFFYKKYHSDTVSIVPFIVGKPCIVTSDFDVAHQLLIGSNKSDFRKMDPEFQGIMSYWGTSLIISEGDVWRKHRRIVGPAFSNELYRRVWEESISTISEMISTEGWEDKKSFDVDSMQRLTAKFALLLIGRCGFGFPFSWAEPEDDSGGITFARAMRTFIDDMILLQLPKWVLELPFDKCKHMKASLDVLRHLMESKTQERERELEQGGGNSSYNDIFTALIQANHMEKNEKLKLDRSELISDIFSVLLAGHESTATALSATIAYLARYPDLQQEIYEQVQSVLDSNRDPTYNDYAELNKVQACFYEGLRLFPPAYIVLRQADKDTVLHVSSTYGEGTTPIAVQEGTQMIVDVVGLNLNPKNFQNPHEFRPSRWYNLSSESESFLGFGIGPRACIGRKFAMLESVCFLTVLLRNYKIEPLTSPGETLDTWVRKVFDAKCLVAMTINDVPVRFVRRKL